MIDYKEIKDGDAWEAFCRDYFVAKGFVIDIPPGRGPDGGRDLLIREQLDGKLASRPFVWLVSCKHYAGSGKSVGTEDETNIRDRLAQHRANGFLGFYSTVASAALITRLKELRDQGSIEAFELFDAARIENGFYDVGLSSVMLQHLPQSHTALRPIHPLLGSYVPLQCDYCGKDLIKASLSAKKESVIIFASHDDVVQEVAFACKGECDHIVSEGFHRRGLVDGWDDIVDYFNPLIFLRRITGYISQMRAAPQSYSDAAHARVLELYLAASQRTLRHTNSEHREDYVRARQAEDYGL